MACLVRATADKFREAIRDGTITPEKMATITSKERQAILQNIVGEENVGWVNAALESKLILKDQQRGMVSWAKQVSGMKEPARRDLVSRIQRQDKVFDPDSPGSFMESLAEKRLGHEVTFDEAKTLTDLANRERIAKLNLKESDPIGSQSRLDYGNKLVAFKDYADHLKLEAEKQPLGYYAKHPLQGIVKAAGVSKSMLSTLDNSYFGRQGIKVLFTHPDIWAKGFIKSWGDIGKELRGIDAMTPIKADIFSRPNAINGKYQAAKVDIGLHSEEAFPSHILSEIPALGRVFKGAESAFNGAALRLRADIADRLIAVAERNGVDTLNPEQAQAYGRLVNSLTGRGNIGRLEGVSGPVNALVFSIKYLKSNFDALTAHQFQKGITKFARIEAGKNYLKTIGGLATVYTLADMLFPGSVEKDPRSSKFGKIQVGDTSFDITGGMGSMATLATRMMPSVHDGKWGFWSKSGDGTYRELGTGKYGSKTPMDVLWDWSQGKAAPYAALLRDIYRGEDFEGNRTVMAEEGAGRFIPTARTVVKAHAPIPAQNFEETMTNPNAAPLLWTTILDGLGFGANTYTPKKKKGSRFAPE